MPGSSAAVPRPHGRHYSTLSEEDPDAPVHDVTEFNPTVTWSAGQVISTTRDLNRFCAALLGGELLPREQVDQMLTTVPIESEESGASGASTAAYGRATAGRDACVREGYGPGAARARAGSLLPARGEQAVRRGDLGGVPGMTGEPPVGVPQAAPAEVGPYRIVRRLGAGGMGQVYLARSAAGRPVAVKTVDSGGPVTGDARRRFAREVALARRVSGAYTAAVVDADPDAAVPWMATEYVPAPSLAELVRTRGPLPADAALWVAAGTAEALAALHAEGIVHRDLKPSNVLLPVAGPRLIDFGISRPADLTRTTVSLGSVAFSAPEQARGEPSTPAADLYALGATVFYLVTGRPPYADTADFFRLLPRVARAEQDLTGLPPELAGAVLPCLRAEAAERPDAAAVVAEFGSRLAARPGAAGGGDWLPGEWLAAIREREAGEDGATPGAAAGGTGPGGPESAGPESGGPDRTRIAGEVARTAKAAGGAPAAPAPARPPLRRRRLTWLVAAAAVVAVAASSIVLVALADDDGRKLPPTAADNGADADGAADRDPPADDAAAPDRKDEADREPEDPYAALETKEDVASAKLIDAARKGDCLTVHYAVIGFEPENATPDKVPCDSPRAATRVTGKSEGTSDDCTGGPDSVEWSLLDFETGLCLDRNFQVGDCFPVREYVGGKRDKGYAVSSSRRWAANLASQSDCSGGSPSRIFEQLARVTAVHPASAADDGVCTDAWKVQSGTRAICTEVIA
ncbi:serine/threonine-protein kinase [Streptomyces sp. CMB-StM0423]|uniref:serine/threonine-protein kinase n=1 Tax=Streptomyces sp. CMB-StM0423 TaxID=2059884 RepID=UPI00131E7F98|nr:serine/threonine-protein kinase [Streptomyces sp. CMB-StM0423]